jgi:hypothetical protein
MQAVRPLKISMKFAQSLDGGLSSRDRSII